MDQSSPVHPVSPDRDRADENGSDSQIDNEDAWSRHVETDAISEGGRMSTTASLLMDDGDQEDADRQGVDMMHPLVAAAAASTTDHDEDEYWSRQVHADEAMNHHHLHRTSSSVLDDDPEHAALVAVAASAATTGSNTTIAVDEGLASVAPPLREEPTLKEKLVERERQRRVETERARLKQQFALRNGNNEESVVEEDEDYHEGDEDNNMMRENGSVAGTVGEGSIVAPVDVLMEDDQNKQMNYPMERFLQEQGTITEEETIRESISSSKRDTQNQGVVMKRFLQEPVVVEPASSADGVNSEHRPSNVDRSVSFDMEPPHSPAPDSPRLDRSGDSTPQDVTTPPRSVSRTGFGSTQEDDYNASTSAGINTQRDGSYLANTSMDCVPSEVIRISDLGPTEMSTEDGNVDNDSIHPSPREHAVDTLPPESPTNDQPRLLGLTLAEIEELAAIEEVSQQNAPPSERDDLSASSFVAELVSDFGGHGNDHHAGGTTLSQGTPTTAMESASIISGNQSAQPSSTVSETGDDRRSMDELENASVNSNLGASSDGGGVSVTANPPSELGHEDTLRSPLADHISSPLGDPHRSNSHDNNAPALPIHQSIPRMNHGHGPNDLSDLATLNHNAGVVNRQIRPGMISANQGAELRRQNRPANSQVVRRVMSMPDKMLDFGDLDGFDYDKDAPASPSTDQFARIQDVSGDDLWSPGSKLSVERSPFRPRTLENIPPRPRSPPGFGRASNVARKPNGLNQHEARLQEHLVSSETDPLMPDIPSEIVTNSRSTKQKANLKGAPAASDNGAVTMTPTDDSQEYMQSSLLQRAFPKRLVAVAVTCLVEVPVLLIIVGGSDRLCSSLGRSTYQLLMGLLPLCSAISGNLGLQTSTLTAQSLLNGQITRKNCMHWLGQEVGTAALLGMATGAVVGLVAFVMSGFNPFFGLAIMIAQGMSMLTAGLTGSLPPLFFTFLLERTAGQWSGLMETAVQDVVSTFVMVVLTYKMLEFCGPFQIDPSDMCYVQPS